MKTALSAVLLLFLVSSLAQELPPADPKIQIIVEAYRLPSAAAAALLGPRETHADALLKKVKALVEKGSPGTRVAATMKSGTRGSGKAEGLSLEAESVRSPAGDAVDATLSFRSGGKELTTSARIRENESLLLGTLEARDAVEFVFVRYEDVIPPKLPQQKLPAGPTEPAVQTVFTAIGDVLAGIDSLEFTTVCDLTKTDIFRAVRKQPAGPNTGLKAELAFSGRQNKYYFTETLTDFVSKTTESTERAFDGKNFQDLDRTTGALFLRKADVPGHHLRMGIYSPLHMFGFLMPVLPGPQATVTWSGIVNPSFWKQSLSNAKMLGEQQFGGKSCVVLQFPGGKNRLFDVQCTFTAYFSKDDGYFPIAWKSQDLTGRILEDYTIKEFGKIPLGSGYFYYPKTATDRCYTANGFPEGAPECITTIETTNLKLNQVDEKIFTIDQMKAKQIVDQDRNVAIPVPK